MTRPAPLTAWHVIADSRDPAGLDAWLADDVVFRSPAVHAPQAGKELTTAYLSAALVVLGPTLHYEHEWYDPSSAVLEFRADLAGTTVHGIDMIAWDEQGHCTSFTVMIRPFRGLTRLMELMGAELAEAAG